MEQLVAFLPGLWAFGIFVSFNWAAGIGAIYLIGRVLYARGYIADPDGYLWEIASHENISKSNNNR